MISYILKFFSFIILFLPLLVKILNHYGTNSLIVLLTICSLTHIFGFPVLFPRKFLELSLFSVQLFPMHYKVRQ